MVSPGGSPIMGDIVGDTAARTSATTVAAELDVVDALVFRRISSSGWAHLGGLGRGRGWAGIINIDAAADPLAFRIPTQVGEVYRERLDEPAQMLGPYHATAGAVVRISNDVAVVLGNPAGPLGEADDAQLLRLAYLVDAEIDDIHPAKRLADELELLTVGRTLLEAPIQPGFVETLRHIATVAMTALSCDIAVLRSDTRCIVIAGETDIDTDVWDEILNDVTPQLGNDLWLAQDMMSVPSQRLRQALPAARSALAIPVPPPIDGRLMVIHTDANPRGFSTQCQRLLRSIAEAGNVIARIALLRDELHAAVERASVAARTDPLTRLGNRLAWDEAIAQAQEEVDEGSTYSVISIDVDGLKDINDRYGHPCGDDLLRRCADLIREHCSPDDLAVRIGGDEFAILVPKALRVGDHTYAIFMRAVSGLRSTRDRLTASIGVSTATPGASLFDAAREADMHMYTNKRERRRQLALQDNR